MKNRTTVISILALAIPLIAFSLSAGKTKQVQLCQKPSQDSRASLYSSAFAKEFSGCKIELARR
ncbi:hypothetical protein BKH46_05995 [Helicobacter sp. 12S02634-8]|uniref:hypothetical protein n=1 Tax=Helicobacter sp. 12S02634-8 TaxID=1476199 RepID=UPI000BA78F43|nr:hypothetical protein [Helicobacter sp. 12S02634-8]PAF46771.1 hypothetical protein BKH46_05995 [Helicobacter sp. 12S02634-8]